MNLEEKILNQYKDANANFGQLPYSAFAHHACCEREKYYKRFLQTAFGNINGKSILEIGAGAGDNLFCFNRMGIHSHDLYANEIVPERTTLLKKHFKPENVFEGNIISVPIEKKFDILFQSTVFSSIPSWEDKMAVAQKMKQLLKPGGVILWYDFVYDNPKNKEVKGVKLREIKQYFNDAKIITPKRVTLAPPLARRVGEAYGFFNTLFPFLRTHLVVLIQY